MVTRKQQKTCEKCGKVFEGYRELNGHMNAHITRGHFTPDPATGCEDENCETHNPYPY